MVLAKSRSSVELRSHTLHVHQGACGAAVSLEREPNSWHTPETPACAAGAEIHHTPDLTAYASGPPLAEIELTHSMTVSSCAVN
jgi:hypothetical protein